MNPFFLLAHLYQTPSLVMRTTFVPCDEGFLSSTVWGNTSDSIMRLLPQAAIVRVMCYFFFWMIAISLPGEVEVTRLHGPCNLQISLSQNKWFPPKCQGGFEEVNLLPLKKKDYPGLLRMSLWFSIHYRSASMWTHLVQCVPQFCRLCLSGAGAFKLQGTHRES